MLQEWFGELAKLALGLILTGILFFVLATAVLSVGRDDSDAGLVDVHCAYTVDGERVESDSCDVLDELLAEDRDFFEADDECPEPDGHIMVEQFVPAERVWCFVQ